MVAEQNAYSMISYAYARALFRRFIPSKLRDLVPLHWKENVADLLAGKNKQLARTSHSTGARMSDAGALEICITAIRRTHAFRVLMFVPNEVVDDARVVKTATSIKGAGFGVLLVGLAPHRRGFVLSSVEDIPVVLLSGRRFDTTADNSLACEKLAAEMGLIIDRLEPTHVYSQGAVGLAVASECLVALNRNGLCHWTHDIPEYLPALDSVIPPKHLEWATQVERARLEAPDQIVVVSEPIRDLLASLLTARQRVHVLHNYPRKQMPAQFDIRAACNAGPADRIAVYHGRATALSGIDIVVGALVAMPDLHVALFSESLEGCLDTLRARAEENGVGQRLHILGYLSDSLVADAIRDADCGLAPSRWHRKMDLALAANLFEYVHAGLPIVASDCALQTSFIRNNHIGEIFPAGDEIGFIKALRLVLRKGKKAYCFSPAFAGRFRWEPSFQAVTEELKSGSLDVKDRILQAPHPSAGQPTALAHGLRAIGRDAWSLDTSVDHMLGYDADIRLPALNVREQRAVSAWALQRFGILHYHFRPIILGIRPTELKDFSFDDVKQARELGRRIVFHFRGSEIRINQLFRAKNPFAWPEVEDPFTANDSVKRALIWQARELADVLVVSDPELRTYVDDAVILPRAIDLKAFDEHLLGITRNCASNQPLRIVHAPTRRAVKGTDIILDTVKRLQGEGEPIEFIVLEKLSNRDVARALATADIVIDQIRIGWYGVLSVEAMAAGATAMAYIREDLLDELEPDCPIVPTNPETLYNDLKILVRDRDRLKDLGTRGRRFVERYHAATRVAAQALVIYEQIALKRT